MFVNVIGLYKKDFEHLLVTSKLNKGSNYILLNKTPNNNNSLYSFRKYIRLTSDDKKNLVVRYNADGQQMSIPIDDYINDFPFQLDGQNKNGIYLFTTMENLEKFVEKYGQDEGEPVNYYNIKIKATKENLAKVSEKCELIISSYFPDSDHTTMNDIILQASDKEQARNEHLLNFGIQTILILLALSNAYNSFHSNLRSRKREFQLLATIGMTERQIKKMIHGESKLLFRKTLFVYILVFISAIVVRSYKSNYDFAFMAKELLLGLNYIPIILIFFIMIIGILLAIKSGIKNVLEEDIFKEI